MMIQTVLSSLFKPKLLIALSALILAFSAGWKIENYRHAKIALKEYQRGFKEAKKQAKKDTVLARKVTTEIRNIETKGEIIRNEATKIPNTATLNNPDFVRLLNETR